MTFQMLVTGNNVIATVEEQLLSVCYVDTQKVPVDIWREAGPIEIGRAELEVPSQGVLNLRRPNFELSRAKATQWR